jgi:hypothetical protein
MQDAEVSVYLHRHEEVGEADLPESFATVRHHAHEAVHLNRCILECSRLDCSICPAVLIVLNNDGL